MDELVDVVDETDTVIGQKMKSLCHLKKMLHRGSAILLFKDKSCQEILLQKRSMNLTASPGKFCIPGGHLEAGENYLGAAHRELQEEVFYGQRLPRLHFKRLYKIQKYTDNDKEFHTVFQVICSGPFSWNPKEVERAFFVGFNALVADIAKNPALYTGTTKLHVKEYQHRYL